MIARRLPFAFSLALALLAPAAASAAPDPVASGSATLTLSKHFRVFLRKDGVKLGAGAPVQLAAGQLTLPMSGGSFDPIANAGSAQTAGTLGFRKAGARVPLTQLVLSTTQPGMAVLAAPELRATRDFAFSSARDGFGVALQSAALQISSKLAATLNKTLHPPRRFRPGQKIGQLAVALQPASTAILPSGAVHLTLAAAFLAKLAERSVTLTPIAPATPESASVVNLPITPGGVLAPSLASGALHSAGSLELRGSGGAVELLGEPWLEFPGRLNAQLEVNPTLGRLGRVGVLDLGAGSTTADPAARTIALAGAPLTLTPVFAETLNQAFAAGEPFFHAGEPLGAISFTAQGQ